MQFARYGAAGAAAALVHLLVLTMLVELFEVEKTISSIIGFCIAIPVNYALQHKLVFGQIGNHGVFFLRYILVTLTAFVLNAVLFYSAVNYLNINYFIAQIIVTSIVMFVNFMVNRRYTFVS